MQLKYASVHSLIFHGLKTSSNSHRVLEVDFILAGSAQPATKPHQISGFLLHCSVLGDKRHFQESEQGSFSRRNEKGR